MAGTAFASSIDANAFDFRFDSYGRKLVKLFNNSGSAIAAGAAHSLTFLKASGKNGRPAPGSIVDTAGTRMKIVVAAEAVADQTWGWFYHSGATITITVPSATYTAGNGLRVDDSDNGIIDSGAQATLDNTADFAAIETGGTTVTSIVVHLYDRENVAQA